MLEIKVNGDGLIERIMFSGNLARMQSDFTVAMAGAYSSLKNSDEPRAADAFVKGLKKLFNDDDMLMRFFDDYAEIERRSGNGNSCKVTDKPKSKNGAGVSEKDLKEALEALEEIAKKLGIDADEDEDD